MKKKKKHRCLQVVKFLKKESSFPYLVCVEKQVFLHIRDSVLFFPSSAVIASNSFTYLRVIFYKKIDNKEELDDINFTQGSSS